MYSKHPKLMPVIAIARLICLTHQEKDQLGRLVIAFRDYDIASKRGGVVVGGTRGYTK